MPSQNGSGSVLDLLPAPLLRKRRTGEKGLRADRPPGEIGEWGRKDLKRSGISIEAAAEFGVVGMSEAEALAEVLRRDPQWVRDQKFGRGLTFTYFDKEGRASGYVRFKPEHPRKDEEQKPIKYEAPLGIPPQVYYPPAARNAFLSDSRQPIVVVEGEKKAICGLVHGINCLGIGGVWSWQKKRDRKEDGKATSTRHLIDGLKDIAWNDREVYIVFDSDIVENVGVQQAERELARALSKQGAKVRAVRLPAGAKGVKTGLDDFLLSHSVPDFWRLPIIDPLEPAPEESPAPKEPPAQGTENELSPWPKPIDGGKLLAELERFLSQYIVLPDGAALIVAAWIMAGWCCDAWDRFPHLAITSPEKRCGKTRFLQLLALLCCRPMNMASISPAALYRAVEKRKPTLLIDEAGQVARRGSESAEVLRELLNAGIDRNATICRCGGRDRGELHEFSIYSPKAVALIGELDEVLADRCIPVRMERKTAADKVKPLRSRTAKAEALPLARKLMRWATDAGDQLASMYDGLELFPLANDRLAELMMPLHCVVKLTDKKRLPESRDFAKGLDIADLETQSHGVQLLAALQDIFKAETVGFLPTVDIIKALEKRADEPWARWSRGAAISPHALAHLLRPFGIRHAHSPDKKSRGYYAHTMVPVYARYLVAKRPKCPKCPDPKRLKRGKAHENRRKIAEKARI